MSPPPPSFSPRYLFTIIPFSVCLPELYLFRSISSGFVYFFFPRFPESLLYFIVLSASLIDITKRSPKITGALGAWIDTLQGQVKDVLLRRKDMKS